MNKRSYTSNQPKQQTWESKIVIIFFVIPLLAAALAVLVSWWRPAGAGPGMRQQGQATEQSATLPTPRHHPAVEREEDDARKVRERDANRSQAVHHSASQPFSESPAAKTAVADFPTDTNIPIGMTKSQLLARFGKPNMITVRVDRGCSNETLVYLRRATDSQTAVQLRSGRVVEVIVSAY